MYPNNKLSEAELEFPMSGGDRSNPGRVSKHIKWIGL